MHDPVYLLLFLAVLPTLVFPVLVLAYKRRKAARLLRDLERSPDPATVDDAMRLLPHSEHAAARIPEDQRVEVAKRIARAVSGPRRIFIVILVVMPVLLVAGAILAAILVTR